jgi:hypothetical protein
MRRVGSRTTACVALVACALCRCSDSPSGAAALDRPGTVALEALALAAGRPLEEARIADLFAVEESSAKRVALFDALETIVPTGVPELVVLDHDGGEPTAFADVAMDSPNGRRAAYSMKLVLAEDRWRGVWLAGPGLEWPARRTRTDAALSVSAHAAGAGER